MTSQVTRHVSALTCCLLSLLLTACWSKQAGFTGVSFPPTEQVDVSFQTSAVPSSCQGFAHLIISTDGPTSGLEIQEAMVREAGEKGANQILVGMAREQMGKRQGSFRFDYFGPKYPYPFPQGWMGWKFGFEQWNKAGPLLGFGLDSWGNPARHYDSSLMIQALFLRCPEK
ncbi:MAG: hypothetical protein K0A99_01990 [Desulfoarculaceae bacterium]|nr:hypothetical protein [Desulfoarculaceae bacterium]